MEQKICYMCKLKKVIEDFSFKNKATGRRSTHCKECHRAYRKKSYQENIEHYKKLALIRKRKCLKRTREKLAEYYKIHPCIDCGEIDPIVLTFDHARGKKQNNVSTLVATGYNWESLQNEIAKCEVRCMNCHTRQTAKRGGWGNIYEK